MRVDLFDFDLDRRLIASEPANPRDSSRLLDFSDGKSIIDRHFYDLPKILEKGDVLVFNNTKVIPARLYGLHGMAHVEVTLYHPVDGLTWHAFVKNAKRLKENDTIVFYTDSVGPEKSGFSADVLAKNGEDGLTLRFNCAPDDLDSLLKQYGFMPLPPYIKRDKPGQGLWNKYNDRENYQTVYAQYEGAVAAPTAGLHFTQNVLDALDAKGVERVFLTLHVGRFCLLKPLIQIIIKCTPNMALLAKNRHGVLIRLKQKAAALLPSAQRRYAFWKAPLTMPALCIRLMAKLIFLLLQGTSLRRLIILSQTSICQSQPFLC